MSEPNMFSKHDMYTQIELLKKEVQDMKGIYPVSYTHLTLPTTAYV